MTSAIQILAERLTPTRQCTKVLSPAHFPSSNTVRGYNRERHTEEVEARVNVIQKRIDAVILNVVEIHDLHTRFLFALCIPIHSFTDTQNALYPKRAQHFRIIRVLKIA